ncbi:MAG TPA: glycogen-binding domain-containing protein [Gemmatimonadales bacterium]|nr:glycogen-binding domain-containing protein [Gemmatimonadales bacterium]
MGPVLFLLATLVALPLALPAQRQASLGAGIGVVRYAGGSSLSTLTLSPAMQILGSSSYFAVSGSASLLDSAVWAEQGRADVWAVLGHTSSRVRPAASATLAASTRSDGVAAGSASALLELTTNRAAVGAGFVTGAIQGLPGVGAFRTRARTWYALPNGAQLSLSAEATRFLGGWYTDLVGGATVDRSRTVASVWVSGRLSGPYGSTGAASASLQYFVSPSVAIEASGGNYLRDPFQGLPRAGFVTAGLRLFAARRAAAVRTGPEPSARPVLQPLVAAHRGPDTVVVRFKMPDARTVAIAGSWNGWTPAPLQPVAPDVWEAALQLAPGTYYFSLVVDGNEWVVPAGVAVIPDGMGGMLAVLNVL